MGKQGVAVEVQSTEHQHVPEIVLSPEVERFIALMERLGICP